MSKRYGSREAMVVGMARVNNLLRSMPAEDNEIHTYLSHAATFYPALVCCDGIFLMLPQAPGLPAMHLHRSIR